VDKMRKIKLHPGLNKCGPSIIELDLREQLKNAEVRVKELKKALKRISQKIKEES
jgi:hypothetical protein